MLEQLYKITKFILVSISMFFFTGQAFAQFTITDNLKGSTAPGIEIGDNAKLTSGDEDPVNAGWLRLTNDGTNQKGYAYVNKSFPSTLGVLIDFEYIMWRTRSDSQYYGADGISVFLFDAMYGPGNFQLGEYGGSLGYANKEGTGVTGGYVGIGLDAYGNFANESEGKNGGSNGLSPNSIVFRGPTTNDSNTTNPYLEGVTILEDGSTIDAMQMGGNAKGNVIDYDEVSTNRPDNQQFYRRVQIEIRPTGTGFYDISVSWATEIGGDISELMTYQTADIPPELLKVGFAASTGGGFNNHEVRNLMITTPGNLRVAKKASKDILRSVSAATGPSNEIEYYIEVINDTPAELTAIDFSDELTDANGNAIPDGMFEITSITTENFINEDLPTPSQNDPLTSGSFEGTLHLASNKTGKIKVQGKLTVMPEGNELVNTTSAFPTTITDEDLLNNTASVRTPVVSEDSDLVITSQVNQSCIDATDGNEFKLIVSNIGVLDLDYGNQSANNKLTVTTDLPSEVTLNNFIGDGWTSSTTGSTYTFTRVNGGTLNSGQSLPAISYTLNSTGIEEYTNTVIVESTGEPVENHHNNEASSTVNATPDAPTANETIYYCLDATAPPLEAAADHTLLWYLNPGGAVSTTPFTPSTSSEGSTTYYVSQRAEGGCESDLTEITVVILENPTAGSITEVPDICPGTIPDIINSDTPGTGGGTISYLWESSTDDAQTWTEIPNQSGETLQPTGLEETTAFRRITLDTEHGIICESEPTEPIWIYMSVSADCAVCTEEITGEAFQWSYSGGEGVVTETMTQPGANGGFQFDIYELDNSFNMEINGVKLATEEIEFQSNGTPAPGINIEFEDGDQYETNTTGKIWEMKGTAERPLIRVTISPSGEVKMYGSKSSEGVLHPLQFKQNVTPINSFNIIPWNVNSDNTIVVTQNIVGATLMDGYGSGRNIVPCETYTLEKEGVFNDENGDGIAQPGETITYTLTVKNAGDLDIYDLILDDPILGGEITVTPAGDENNDGVLNTYEEWVYTVDYTITQTDINNKGVYNLATVSGENVLEEPLDSETSVDPNPLDPDDPMFDPNRPDHTFVPLKGRSLLITNPMIYQRMKSN